MWLDAKDIGDWGYGIYVVVRAIGEPQQGDHPVWVRLAGVAEEAWIELQPPNGASTSGLLEGALTPLVGSSLAVEDGIPARDLRLRRRLMLPSTVNYVAERLTPNQLLVRREVGADMPCADDVKEKERPTAATPRYRVAVDDLFRKDGRPRVRYAHPRGC